MRMMLAKVSRKRFLDSIGSAATTRTGTARIQATLHESGNTVEVLGHSSISLTANTYSHVMPSLVADAAEKIGSVLFGA
jgi:hypothetical protein